METFELLARIEKPYVVDAVLACLAGGSEVSRAVRIAALGEAHRFPCRRVLDALVKAQTDDAPTGSIAFGVSGTAQGYRLRYSDLAAQAIRRMVGYEEDYPADSDAAVRDAFTAKLLRYVATHADEIDREKLRGR